MGLDTDSPHTHIEINKKKCVLYQPHVQSLPSALTSRILKMLLRSLSFNSNNSTDYAWLLASEGRHLCTGTVYSVVGLLELTVLYIIYIFIGFFMHLSNPTGGRRDPGHKGVLSTQSRAQFSLLWQSSSAAQICLEFMKLFRLSMIL